MLDLKLGLNPNIHSNFCRILMLAHVEDVGGFVTVVHLHPQERRALRTGCRTAFPKL